MEQLLDAIIAKNKNLVTKILNEGADPNYFEDCCELRPLHFAALYNLPDVISLLIMHGANPTAESAEGTPFEVALANQNTEAALTLGFYLNLLTKPKQN